MIDKETEVPEKWMTLYRKFAIIAVGGMMFMMTAWITGIIFGFGFREITNLIWGFIRRRK